MTCGDSEGKSCLPVPKGRRESTNCGRFCGERPPRVAGPSGVGKSSLINLLCPDAKMETGGISRKIDRGRHTTRHCELFCVEENTFIMDTPGFSSLDLPFMEKEELKQYFPEFVRYEGQCRFQGCAHIKEPDCRVREAVDQGEISRARYEGYVSLYEELKERRKY